MLKFFKFLKQHKKIFILCIVLLILLPPVVIHILYKVPAYNDFFKSEWEPGDLLTQTSHTQNGIRTLKNQYFSPQSILK